MAKIVTPNLLDRLVMGLSPRAGLERLRSKARAQVLMNYDAATRGRRASGWRAPASSADAAGHDGGARQQMRNLARDFVRNRPFAARGLSVITSNVVGPGVMPSVEARTGRARDEARALVERHLMSTAIDAVGQNDLPRLQRIAMNAVVQDGEVLLRRRWRNPRYEPGLALPFQVELWEADYLDTAKTSHGQNEVIEGVEYGPTGRIEAYHLYRQHPGTVYRRLRLDSVRVPASEIIHLRRADRPGQTRGVSWFAPVMLTLGDLSDYQEAEILKQKIAALLAGFLESDVGEDDPIAGSDEEAERAGLGEIAPGTLTELPVGKRIKFTDPPEINGYDGFMRQNLAAVAMGLGITYESLAGDLSGVNFSSARMGRMEMDRNIEVWQQQIVISQMCVGLVQWFRDAAELAGYRWARDIQINWTAPKRALVDPTREIPAIIDKIEGGLSSRQREQRALGLDPELIARERAEDEARPGAPAAGADGTAARRQPVREQEEEEADDAGN